MNLDTAQQSGVLAAKIVALTTLISKVQEAVDAQNIIQNLTLRTVNSGDAILDLPLGTLDAVSSGLALNLAKTILQAQLDAVTAQLNAL